MISSNGQTSSSIRMSSSSVRRDASGRNRPLSPLSKKCAGCGGGPFVSGRLPASGRSVRRANNLHVDRDGRAKTRWCAEAFTVLKGAAFADCAWGGSICRAFLLACTNDVFRIPMSPWRRLGNAGVVIRTPPSVLVCKMVSPLCQLSSAGGSLLSLCRVNGFRRDFVAKYNNNDKTISIPIRVRSVE